MKVRLSFLLLLMSIGALARTEQNSLAWQKARFQAEVIRRMQSGHDNSTNVVSNAKLLGFFQNQGVGSISGRLYNVEPEALANAWVEAFSADFSSDQEGFAKGLSLVDKSGLYRITDLPEGNYYVLAYAEGYEPLFYRDATDIILALPVVVSANRDTEGIDFYMRRIQEGKSTITGRVTDASTGKSIAGAIVSAFGVVSGEIGWAETDENGNYSLTKLKAGTYYLVAWAQGYLQQYYNNKSSFLEADQIAVGDSVVLKNFNFRLQRGGSISGRVTYESGRPVVEAYLTATPVGNFDPETEPTFGKALTDENGNYIIEGLRSGDYIVELQARTKWQWFTLWYNQKTNPDEADKVRVVIGEDTGDINFIVPIQEAAGSIRGIVQDTEGNPIFSAYIGVQSADPNQWIYAYASTDEEGRYLVEELPDGRYYVSVGVQNGWQYIYRWWPGVERFEEAQPIFVSKTAPATADFTLPLIVGRSSIAGRVTDTSGRPLVGASLSIIPASGDNPEGVINAVWAWATTDSEGYYRVKQLPGGRYQIYCSYWEDQKFGEQWWNHKDSQEKADVLVLGAEEERNDIDFSLTVKPVFGAIVGAVFDSLTGMPVQRALVQITAAQRDEVWGNNIAAAHRFYWRRMAAITDENGRFAIDWLYEGDYHVSVYANGAFEYYENAPVVELAKRVKVIGGEKSEIAVKIAPRRDGKGMIQGRVLMEGTQTPFEIAVVTAQPAIRAQIWPQSEMFYTAVADTNGNFILSGLPENTKFLIYAFSIWTIGEYYNNVYDPEEATLVRAGYPEATLLKDIELPVYRWLWNGPEDGGRNVMTGQVVGRVTDGDGEPIAGARIIAFNESRQPVADALTDSQGNYELSGLPFGNYILRAGRFGYKSIFNNNAESFEDAKPITLGANRIQVNFILALKTEVVEEKESTPQEFQLLGNYPNPFNPETVIVFKVPNRSQVLLSVYNLSGKKVATLMNRPLEAGRYEIKWDGRDETGKPVSSGVYIYSLQVDGLVKSGKMVLIR
ncbi:MAG: carboxypeptidase regulatory-like domain-containing protein [candidate division KSB1 bacterium]|nr:carboxypeptidase regulatory-like domain-containing protein [candidate division KSB1 bacterium]